GRRRRKVEFNRPKGGRMHCKVSCCVSNIMLNKSILLAKKEAVIIMLRLSIICCQGPSDVRRPGNPARCFHAAAGGFPRVFRGSARWSNRLHGAPAPCACLCLSRSPTATSHLLEHDDDSKHETCLGRSGGVGG